MKEMERRKNLTLSSGGDSIAPLLFRLNAASLFYDYKPLAEETALVTHHNVHLIVICHFFHQFFKYHNSFLLQ